MAAAPVLPAPTPAPETAPLSEGARLINVFIAPSRTFTDLRRSASWWVPWLLISVFSLLFSYAVDRQVTFEQISKNEIARSPKVSDRFDKATPAQQAQQLRIMTASYRYSFYGIPALILLIDLIIAAVLFATFKFAASADLKFKTTFAVVMYAGLPGIVNAILGTISMFAGINPEGFNVNNPVGTNPAYYMDPATNKFVLGLASSLDLIAIWTIVLLGIGFACTSKVKRSTAITIVAVWYLVWKVGTAALAAARG
jgi:hypothetical protein